MIKLFKKILRPIRRIRARVSYDRAVRLADEQFAKTHQRHYIIKAKGRKLMVINRDDFRMLKKKGILHRRATVMSLEARCIYCTTYNNGKGEMPESVKAIKKEQAIRWMSE